MTKTETPDPYVEARPKRRRFTADYKLRILEEAETTDNIGALLRREGLYASNLSVWRRARREGALSELKKKRGRKPSTTAEQKRIEELERENARLQARLRQAEVIIDVQKKVSQLMGIDLDSDEKNS